MKIYSWGANSHGQTASGDFIDYSVPNEINISVELSEIKKIYCGSTYSFIIKKDGSVFVCGNNDQGQLGFEEVKQCSRFIKIERLFNVKVTSVATGWDFSVILLENGDIFTSGNNQKGQLGLEPSEIKQVSKFTKISIPPMTSVKAGMWHVVALTEQNDVWTWGYNNRAQVGVWPPNRASNKPARLNISDREEVLFIVAGVYHSGFMTRSYKITMWGDNKYGQCGYNPSDDAQLNLVGPRTMESSLDDVVQFESGWSHALARDSKGRCYTWGHNRYMELGRTLADNKMCDPIPGCVESFIEKQIIIKEISCGNQHSTAVDEYNRVWSWGWNDHGMLGQGDLIDKVDPLLVHCLPSSISLLSYGGSHSFALCN